MTSVKPTGRHRGVSGTLVLGEGRSRCTEGSVSPGLGRGPCSNYKAPSPLEPSEFGAVRQASSPFITSLSV